MFLKLTKVAGLLMVVLASASFSHIEGEASVFASYQEKAKPGLQSEISENQGFANFEDCLLQMKDENSDAARTETTRFCTDLFSSTE